MDGGQVIAKILASQGVKFVFTLIGGHISPILIGSKKEGIRVIDVRHEVNAVFAADAVSRVSGVPGIAVVTAGPGVTNTITAVKNASMAQSPLILIGGATATVLKGRGSLQDIDQMALMKPHVKWATSIKRVKDIAATFEKAFKVAQEGVPGPVFIECPIDLLYDESLVRQMYGIADAKPSKSMGQKFIQMYLNRSANKIFKHKEQINFPVGKFRIRTDNRYGSSDLEQVKTRLKNAKKPVVLMGSQAMLDPTQADAIKDALNSLGIPTFLAGMTRGLLGKDSAIQIRHKRRKALAAADLVILAGVSCDFRLDYGRHISSKAFHIAINRSKKDVYKNKRPNIGLVGDPGNFIIKLANVMTTSSSNNTEWLTSLKKRDQERDDEITQMSSQEIENINPIELFKVMDQNLPEKSSLIVDGGDFVGTGAYTLRPRHALSWLDPGVFGTLGVGAGFALGVKLCRPEEEVWVVWGDGSSAYSILEYDTFVRHNVPVVSVIGNDACWSQIAREQVDILKDDVGTVLAHSDYHTIANAMGAAGKRVETIDEFKEAVKEGQESVKNGTPYVINAIIGKTDFRKGSISM